MSDIILKFTLHNSCALYRWTPFPNTNVWREIRELEYRYKPDDDRSSTRIRSIDAYRAHGRPIRESSYVNVDTLPVIVAFHSPSRRRDPPAHLPHRRTDLWTSEMGEPMDQILLISTIVLYDPRNDIEEPIAFSLSPFDFFLFSISVR